MRFREQATETAGFYNTVGFNDDTRHFFRFRRGTTWRGVWIARFSAGWWPSIVWTKMKRTKWRTI